MLRLRSQIRRLSTKIPASTYKENSKEWRLRKNLQDSYLLPNKQRVYPPNDWITSSFTQIKQQKENYRLQQLINYVAEGNRYKALLRFESLYQEDPSFLRDMTSLQRSSLLRILITSVKNADEIWPIAETVATAIKTAGSNLRPHDYAKLIYLAFHADKHNKVESLWNEINLLNIPKTTILWNSYIMASCNLHPWYWSNIKKLNYKLSEDKKVEPPAINDAISLFQEMNSQGIEPDARTHELLILWFAKQKGDLDGIKTISATVWGAPNDNDAWDRRLATQGSKDIPTISTISTLIHAYGLCGEVERGIQYCSWLAEAYRIRMKSRAAKQAWYAMLYWAYVDKKSPRRVFGALWKVMTDSVQLKPDFGLYYLRLRWLETSANTTGAPLLRQLKELRNVHPFDDYKVLQSIYLNRTCRFLCKRGRMDYAMKITKQWAEYDAYFNTNVELLQNHIENSRRPAKHKQKRRELIKTAKERAKQRKLKQSKLFRRDKSTKANKKKQKVYP